MKFIPILCLSTCLAFSAQKQLEIKSLIYRNTAIEVFPSLSFGEGATATLKLTYDDQTEPSFTGSMLLNPDGTPRFNAENEIDYDASVDRNSPLSNESRYDVVGQITLDIDGHTWTGNGCKLVIYNNVPTLTRFDGIFIECDLRGPDETLNVETQFRMQIKTLGEPSMVDSTALPSTTESISNVDRIILNFSLRPVSERKWVINSNLLNQIKINPINA